MSMPPPPPPAPFPSQPAAAPSEQKARPLAKIALGVAIAGFVFACIPGALIVGWVLLPIAFILSIVALFQPGRKRPAIAALIVSIVGTIVGFVVFLAVVVDVVDDAIDEASDHPSDYGVTIDGTHQGEDYEGKPALVVDLTFTNDSDEDASYLWSLTTTAYQNGVELERATLDDESGDGSKEIKPGASMKVQDAFILNDASEVTLEVTEAISFNERVLATEKVEIEAAAGEAFGDDHREYDVTIDGFRRVVDYEGKPALQVDFTFTNNSSKAQSFAFAVSSKAFQDGTELEDAFLSDSDAENSIKDIKPGKSIKVQETYLLDGKAEVTVEVTELISLDEVVLATRSIPIK